MPTLNQLIAEGEHLHQDFKFRIDDQRKIARTLCAFANTEGGRLLIGVKDNRKVVGCDPAEEFHMIEGAAKMFCQPEVKFSSKIWQEDFRLVLQIDVWASDTKPHRAQDDDGRWKPYIRINDHTTAVNKILEWVWKERQQPTAKPEKFDAQEMKFLKLIHDEQPVTLSKLYRRSGLPLRTVDRLLVLFICWDLVEMNFENDGTYYSISEEENLT
jgi:predicted HTH transcriptional regulator